MLVERCVLKCSLQGLNHRIFVDELELKLPDLAPGADDREVFLRNLWATDGLTAKERCFPMLFNAFQCFPMLVRRSMTISMSSAASWTCSSREATGRVSRLMRFE